MKFIFLSLFVFLVSTSNGQAPKTVNSNDFIMECMKAGGEAPHKELAIWMPYNFWEIVGSHVNISPEMVKTTMNEMKKYNLFCIMDYTSYSGVLTFKTADEIRKTLQLTDSSHTVYTPLSDDSISATAKLLIENIEPAMSQVVGQFGRGMRFFLFKAKQVNGQPEIDIKQKNSFTLTWDNTSLKWEMPFASVLPVKYCPIDNEPMKGTWNFCPVHGVKLN